MKNIKTIILAACAVTIAFSSCKDDDDDTATQSVNVVSVTSTSFEATGGTDTITVDKPITDAYTNVSWATLTTDKSSNAVYVTAAANSSKESRHATVVVKASPVDSTIVNIDQFGTVFSTSLPESRSFSATMHNRRAMTSQHPVRRRSPALPTGSQLPSRMVRSTCLPLLTTQGLHVQLR